MKPKHYKFCRYCRHLATYRIRRGRTRLFACNSPEHRTRLANEATERFSGLARIGDFSELGFTPKGNAARGPSNVAYGTKTKAGDKRWDGSRWVKLCKTCGQDEHADLGGCFRCGKRTSEVYPYSDSKTIVVRQIEAPTAPPHRSCRIAPTDAQGHHRLRLRRGRRVRRTGDRDGGDASWIRESIRER
jgi:hypothetical protein